MMLEPDTSIVCIREIQKSLKFSAKLLIENKIHQFGLDQYFDITQNEIRRKHGKGVCIFQGMQDHTAESIKSLEGFKYAWVEEAQSLSARSLKLLRPTIRMEGSEIWFTWNPDQPTDAVDQFFCGEQGTPDNALLIHVNLNDNPFEVDTLRAECESDRKRMSDEDFAHVWEGAYNLKSDSLVFAGKYRIEEFEPKAHWSVVHGLDFGFANDPTAAIKAWVGDDKLWIEYEAGRTKLELDDTALFVRDAIPGIQNYVLRSDSARPESISYLKRHGLPKIKGVKKWSGSVEDGVEHIRSYQEVVIHPRCKNTIQEFRLYSYKIDRKTGDVLPQIIDANNHYIDALRYALEPMIKRNNNTLGGYTVNL